MREKNYGIDTLRILAMFMVTILHILTQGGILNASSRFTSQYEAGWFLQTAAFCAVDIYALISGYVWVSAQYRYRNIMELWLQVLFYTVSITTLFWIFVFVLFSFWPCPWHVELSRPGTELLSQQ